MPNDIITNVEHKPLTPFQQSYHWRNKNCSPWAQDWVKRSLPGLSVQEGGASAEIKEVTSVSGDCDLGQRKGKLLTIYDLEVEAKWEGKTADGEEVKGNLRIPEFSHEAIDGLSDYVFEFTGTTPSNAGSSALVATLRKAFPPVLIAKLNSFRGELLEANGIFSDTVPSSSGTSTPGSGPSGSAAYSPAPPGAQTAQKAAAAPAPAKEEKPKKAVTSTTVVEVSATLQASADDLWSLLTDANRIPMWTRAPAQLELKEGGAFALFDGNIRGQVKSFEPAKKMVQSWQVRKPEWPVEHFGTMTVTLDQGSDSTEVKFSLEGVPSGQETDIEKALDTFYIRGLKQMGLGTIL